MIKLLNRIFDFLEKLHEQVKLAVKRKKEEEFKDDIEKGDVSNIKDKFRRDY